MGKVNKKHSIAHSNHHDNPHRSKKAVSRRQYGQNSQQILKAKVTDRATVPKHKSNSTHGHHQPKPRIPFSKHDSVLLIGEGDFSFALSLMQNHKVNAILATCFDTKEALEQKYPTVTNTIKKLSSHHIEGNSSDPRTEDDRNKGTDEVWGGFSSADQSESGSDLDAYVGKDQTTITTKVLYGIDATKLASTHKKMLRTRAPFTKIVFNFPHVGGLSTDVNRQVRSNQQLLVDFFNAAQTFLATKSNPAKLSDATEASDELDYNSHAENERNNQLEHGQILVTIFEGEPYTLWNIRDLARHSGLKVLESFKFPWAAYPGYKHARTVGDIVTGKDRAEEGKRKGAWRGEERDARCYILAIKDDDDGRPKPGSRKRKKAEDDDD